MKREILLWVKGSLSMILFGIFALLLLAATDSHSQGVGPIAISSAATTYTPVSTNPHDGTTPGMTVENSRQVLAIQSALLSSSPTISFSGNSSVTQYYVRAYAINSAGTSYGGEESFTIAPSATDITITTSASSGSGWSISGGTLTATETVLVNYIEIENALADGDLIISSSSDIIIDADITPVLSANRTLTLKAARDINIESNRSIAANDFALNTILWSDTDALEGGMIYLKTQAEIATNGGHLWIGGGNGSTNWNGLTVGNGTSIGNTNNSNGITLVKTNIQTSGGSIAFYGKGMPGTDAGVSIPISTGFSTNTNGIRMHDGNSINSGSGAIYMYGFADNSNSTSNSNGVELSQTSGAGDVITSSNNTENAIFIEGYAEGPVSVANSYGFCTHLSTIQNTGGGNIHIKGSAVKNAGVTVAGNGAVLANSGKIVLEGTASGASSYSVFIQGAVGQKTGTSILSSSTDIEIIGDKLSISGTAPNGRIQSSGVLSIRPYTANTDIGIGSAISTLQLPASYFNTNFVDGFFEIIVGDENAGLITVDGAIIYRDHLTLKTKGNIFFTADADLNSPVANPLTLWTRASGNNEANDANPGAIWMQQGSVINTAGGDLTMGGGADPNVGYAMGDGTTTSAENNARYRGIAMNGSIDAAGGNIIINGKGASNIAHTRGTSIGGAIKTTGAANITVRGIGKGASDAIALGDTFFTPNADGILETGSGNITLTSEPSGPTRNGLNLSTSGSYIKTTGDFSTTTTGRITATAGSLDIGGNTTLNAGDNIVLTNSSNDFDGSINVNGAANLQISDQNELTLGGINVTGIVDIATLNGDLFITENIITTDASTDAIKLFADKTKSAGDNSGGNIKISGTPTISTGVGGQAKLYSGSGLESANLIALVGEENTRYEVDANTVVFDPVLSSGNYALIREEAGVLLSTSPTISFSNNSGFGDNIASDGEGGSTGILDLNIEIYPINSSAIKLTVDPLQYHDNDDWPGYPAIITYGDTNPHYGWVVKSDNGDDFSLVKIDFHEWGDWGGDIFVAEAFLNGSSKGSVTFAGNTDGSYVELANPGILTAIFGNVDEVRLYRQGGANSYISLNNVQVSTAVGNTAPTASNISITGTLEVGEQLTGEYDYSDADSDAESGSTYKWYRSDDAAGLNKAAIGSATAQTYTLVAADENKFISFEVTPHDGTTAGTTVESSRIGPVSPSCNDPIVDETNKTLTIAGGSSTKIEINATGGSLSYQWQVSTNGGGSYSDISDGGNYQNTTTDELSLVYVPESFSGYKYQCIVSEGVCAVTSGVTTLSISASPLCASTPTEFGYEYVSSISINGVNFDGNTDFTGPGYYDYTMSPMPDITAGTSIPVSVTVVTNASYQEYVKIWIDFNRNGIPGDVDSPGELVFDQNNTFSGTYTFTGNIAIPSDAYNGNLYARLIMQFDGSPEVCGDYDYGNTFDFRLPVIGGEEPILLNVGLNKADGSVGEVSSDPAGINSESNSFEAMFSADTEVTLTATPEAGSVFEGWTGDITSLDNPLVFTMDASKNLLAKFSVAPPAVLPTVATAVPTSFAATSATLGGNVTHDGHATVTERGIVYNTTGDPTTSDTKVQIGSGTGTFSQSVTGLTESTAYYVRAYAINSEGTSYGDEESFTTPPSNNLPIASNVTFSGTLNVGQELTGDYDYSDSDEDAESGSIFQWYQADDASGTNKSVISGAELQTYTLQASDIGKFISFEVIPHDGTTAGTAVESSRQGPITNPKPDINVKGNTVDITDGDITPDTGDHTDFGSVATASGTVSRTFTIENTGSLDLTLIEDSGRDFVFISGANASDFTVTTQPNEFTAPAGSTTFTVEFDPSAIGERNAMVNITSDDPDENPYTFAIKGTGLNSAPAITSTTSINIDENIAAAQTITATDADSHTLTFSISGGADAALFDINASTGALTFDATPDFENPTDANTDNIYIVDITVSDGNGGTDTETLNITVNDLNDESPVFTSSSSVDVDENETSVITVTATDADAGSTVTFSITGGADQALFSIDGSTGALAFSTAPDHESPTDANTDNDFIVQVTASDGTNTTAQTITVSVQDVNDNSPVFTSANTADVDENTTSVITVIATDADASSTVSYSITGGADQALFSIDGTTGALTFDNAPDFENPADADTDNDFIVQVTASDGTNTVNQTITVSINDLNDESPAITSASTASIAENTTAVLTVTATDADAGSSLSFSITGGADQASFSIDGSTGALTFNSAPDFENPADTDTNNDYIVEVTVSDGVNSSGQTITVTVDDINDEAPVITASQEFSIDENSANGTVVGTITATDADGPGLQDWTITGGNTDGAFALNASTGQLTVANINALDRETTASFILEVAVSDGVNTSASEEVVIDLDDANDNHPVFQNTPYSASVVEDAATGTSVFTVEATDADAGVNAEIIYSITGGNTNGDFVIDANSGEIMTANTLDRNITSSYSLQITATDQGAGSLTDVSTVSITVDDVNDNAPIIQNEPYSTSINEDIAIGTLIATISATDADEGINAEIEYSITDGNSESKFTIDSSTGEITVAQALDYETTTGYTLEVTASDKGIPVLSDVTTVTITVLDVNDNAPEFQGEPYAASIAEDAAVGTALITVNATDEDSGINAQISYSISDGNTNDDFAIDAITGEITVAKSLDRETVAGYLLEVTATDGGTPSNSSTSTVAITVTDINDNCPVFANTPYQAEVAEDAAPGTSVFAVEATDADEGVNAEMQYSITGGNVNNAFALDANTGVVTVNNTLDRESLDSYALEITATDQGAGNLSASTVLNIVVTDVNDNAPVAVDDNFETDEDTQLQVTAPGVLANDTDEDVNTTLTATVVDQPSHGSLTLNTDGSFSYTPDADYYGTDSFTYQAGDGEFTSNTATVNINIHPVNDAPTVSSMGDVEIEINSTTPSIEFTIGDIDSDLSSLSVSVTADNNTLLSVSGIALSGSGDSYSLVLTPATDETGTTQITIVVSDGELETEEVFTLVVYPVNVAPTDIALSNNTFIESIAIGEEVGIFTTADENSDDIHTYSLVSGEGDHHNDLSAIEGNKLITNGEYDYEMAEELSIRIRTTDRWGETYEKIFTLILIADPELELLIPTAITPNNDGENDTWEIDNISLHPHAVVKVFNRDGREVFASEGYEEKWDGFYNGNALPFGTYYFIIDLKDSKKRTYKGTVMIIK